jgi:hypothetical protein
MTTRGQQSYIYFRDQTDDKEKNSSTAQHSARLFTQSLLASRNTSTAAVQQEEEEE